MPKTRKERGAIARAKKAKALGISVKELQARNRFRAQGAKAAGITVEQFKGRRAAAKRKAARAAAAGQATAGPGATAPIPMADEPQPINVGQEVPQAPNFPRSVPIRSSRNDVRKFALIQMPFFGPAKAPGQRATTLPVRINGRGVTKSFFPRGVFDNLGG